MGEYADMALDEMMDFDEAVMNGYYDDPDNLEDDMVYMYPFTTSHRPKGKGLCPRCNAPTVLKHGKRGPFYGCTRFPHCRGSRDC